MANTALLIIRLTVGLLFIGHGSQKLFGAFGGPGMAGHSKIIEKQGFHPVALWATTSAWAEFAGGLLMALGLFTPVAAALIISVMVMAIAKVHRPKGLWNINGGYEFNLTLIASTLALGLAGPGALALDNLLPSPFAGWQVFIVSLIIFLIGDGIGLMSSSPRAPEMRQRPM